MIVGRLDNTKEIEKIHKHLPMVFSWLRANARNIHNLGKSRIDLIDNEVYVNIETKNLKEPTESLIEIHHRYIDVHVPINIPETIGWESSKSLVTPIKPYDKEHDIAFYYFIPSTYLHIRPGHFCIMTPDDGHAPLIGTGEIKKLCVKIKI